MVGHFVFLNVQSQQGIIPWVFFDISCILYMFYHLEVFIFILEPDFMMTMQISF